MNRKYIVICSFLWRFLYCRYCVTEVLSMQKSRNRKKMAQQNAAQTSTKQEQRVTSETKLVIEKWEEESEELVKRRKRHATGYAGLTKGRTGKAADCRN